jgi:hypothetical protein
MVRKIGRAWTPALQRLVLSWAGWIGRQCRRPRRKLLGIRLYRFHDLLNRSIELRIFAADYLLGAVLYHNIRLNASVLDYPLALIVVPGKLGPGNVAAVHERKLTSNAANTAPGALADKRA